MRKPMILALTIFASIPFIAYAAGSNPEPGQPHPDFIFPAIDDGRPVTLSQFRGQKILLIEFASW
jgi:hypothetical protein